MGFEDDPMQQMFFVFPKHSEVALSKEDQFECLSYCCFRCCQELSNVKLLTDFESDPDFAYCLVILPRPVDAEAEDDLKDLALSSAHITPDQLGIDDAICDGLYLPCDLLFSDDFPCFNDSDLRAGALVMDMDMTTVQIEGIDELARCLGVFDEVAAITHEAMYGKLDFSQSLRRRVSLLKGGDANELLSHVKQIMTETSGLKELLEYCNGLKQSHNFKTCIASGGFHELISVIKDKYGLDHIAANRLKIGEDNKFTGEVDGPIVDGQAKADLVRWLKSEEQKIPQERIIVLGDGANDLLMMNEGGLGIAYHAKPTVQQKARNVLNHGDLRAVAALLRLRAQA